MVDNSSTPTAQPPSHNQSNVAPLSQPETIKQSPWQEFCDAFIPKKRSKEENNPLYQKYEQWAESVKITLQMLIGIVIAIALLLQVIAFIFDFWPNPFFSFLTSHNPLYIVAFGLFFSTGIDLAYMLFTPGPDEAIDPVMTGLAAAILLGVGKIDFSTIQLEQGIALFLSTAALAGLFATKKYLFHPLKKNKKGKKNKNQPVEQENEIVK